MTAQSGMFFTIESSFAELRAAQFERLVHRIQKAGLPVERFSFPELSDPSSYFYARYLQGDYGDPALISPYAVSLFAALHHYDAGLRIRRALAGGAVVIATNFTGAALATQAARFGTHDERRGYALWLNNLQKQVLGLPRPALNLVLNVPASYSEQLAGRSGAVAHENLAVGYQELSTILPDDYTAIDCVRGGQLLDEATLHAMIFEKIRPYLPVVEPAVDETATKQTALAVEATDSEIAEQAAVPVDPAPKIEVSQLLRRALPINVQTSVSTTKQGNFAYYLPSVLKGDARRDFKTAMRHLQELHRGLEQGLVKFASEQSGGKLSLEQLGDATKAADLVLPLAAVSLVSPKNSELETVLRFISSDTSNESRELLREVLGSIRRHDPGFMDGLAVPVATKAKATATADLVAAHLSGHYVESVERGVNLTRWSPKNELETVADIAYMSSDMSLDALKKEVLAWPYETKAEVVSSFYREHLGDYSENSVLQSFRYTWDVVSDFKTSLAIGSGRPGTQWQAANPRYGYATPKIIEQAGLSDLYDDCFDTSLQLFSKLQQAGFGHETPYATLLGHNVRWNITTDANEVLDLYQQSIGKDKGSSYRQLVEKMLAQLAEHHQMLSEAIYSEPKGK